MLIPGSKLGYWLGDRNCFLAVFRYPQLLDRNAERFNAQTILGNVVMKNYYLVFDAES